MRVAALYDVHANVHALRAVLPEAGRADLVLVGGDVVWGPWPRETMELLRGLGEVRFIIGNADRDVFDRVDGDWKVANDWCADRSSADDLAFLSSRPATESIDGVLYCHGSPRSDEEAITSGTTEDRIREAFAGVAERTVVFGHTHAQFERTVDAWRLVNPGSVGNPFGDAGFAYWATFTDGEPELRATPYDVEACVSELRMSGFPHADMLCDQLLRPAPASAAAEWFS